MATPYTMTVRSSAREKRKCQGRQTMSKISEAIAKRSAAVPTAPTAGNKLLARVAPS